VISCGTQLWLPKYGLVDISQGGVVLSGEILAGGPESGQG
jgi:hypothetical protein